MKKLALFVLAFSLMSFSAIAAPIPGETVADKRLKKDISNMIYTIERAQAPKCKGKIVDTKTSPLEDGSVKEDWIVESCGNNLTYEVTITPDPKGGAYFGVMTPKRQ